jgi:hypothetical protein
MKISAKIERKPGGNSVLARHEYKGQMHPALKYVVDLTGIFYQLIPLQVNYLQRRKINPVHASLV